MKYLKIGLAAFLFITIISCKKMSYFQVNPNEPTVADPSLELGNIEQNMFSVISEDAGLASRQMVRTQELSDAQYYGWQRSSMNYADISQVVKMQQEALRTGKMNYYYIGKFCIDYYIIDMTEAFGDIPYSQMMQSIENNNFDSAATHPVYDKQEDIYVAVLNDLKIASDSLSTKGVPIIGDIIYNGNILQWKKLINSFTLRVLMSLSLHADDASLNIQQRFNNIATNPETYPLFSSNDDNGELQYYNITGNQYPYYNENHTKTEYYMDSGFVKMLQDLKDPRLFTFALPTPNAVSAGLSNTDFNAYGGLPGSADFSYNNAKSTEGNASQINARYAYDPVNEPSVLMGYAELQFILAEAVERGWISGNAQTYYQNGINASLEFSDYNNTYSEAGIAAYLNQSIIALQPSTAIQQIITQKYISMFMNSGWQSFYEHRRTGWPVFDISGPGIINQVKGVNAVPLRWMYPIDEYTNNAVNVQNAVNRQYPNGDNINGIMWLIQ